jgi:hypothetical protein
MMEWFRPLLKELKNLLVPLALAVAIGIYGFAAPNPPFMIAGAWALVVTIALAVFRSLPREGK